MSSPLSQSFQLMQLKWDFFSFCIDQNCQNYELCSEFFFMKIKKKTSTTIFYYRKTQGRELNYETLKKIERKVNILA